MSAKGCRPTHCRVTPLQPFSPVIGMADFRLEKLEVCNFKSYRGKHTVEGFADFTAIVGPNGSGKSNLLDAFAFVLVAARKASEIRGVNLASLVNSEVSLEGDDDTECYVEMTVSVPD
ncbi:hypothetical protein KIPB_005907, partial [Kipferlia bialata]|eukprot:g5907.t1